MSLRVTALAAALALVAAACTSGGSDPRPAPPPATAEAAGGADAACPAGLEDAVAAWGDAGFTGVFAMRQGDRTCSLAAGLRDPETSSAMTGDAVFAIGSVSKSFTAAAILQLAEQGRLSLDDPAGSLVPGLGGPAARATVAQLLTHTSGLHGDAGEDHEPLSRAAAVAALSALPQTFPAGTDFGYTNAGYTVLALVIEAVTGDYRAYLARHILPTGAGFWDGAPAPRGPRAVGYTEDGRSPAMGQFDGAPWATSGNGDLAMTMPRLAAWAVRLFDGGVLGADGTTQLRQPRWRHGDGTAETYGWVRFDASLFGAVGFAAAGGGGDTGHNVVVAFLPRSDTAIAIGSSTDGVSAEQLLRELIPALIAHEDVPLPEGAGGAAPDLATVRRFEGTYAVGSSGTVVVTRGDDGALASASGAAAARALFGLPTGLSPADVAAHEAGVVALLTGDDPVGAGERDAVGEAVGGIEGVRLRGTVADHGELRTYVTVVGGEQSLDGWYALDDHGGVAAAQLPADPPTLVFDRQRGDTLVSVDPTGRRDDARLTLDNGVLTIDNGAVVTLAHRRPG